MAPPRGKRVRAASPSASTPLRKSARLQAQQSSPTQAQQSSSAQAQQTSSTKAQLSSATRQQSAGLSIMSTETDTSQSWEALYAEATDRIDRYKLNHRPDEAVLKASLHAFLEWLPEKGRGAVARDIKNSISDDSLYSVFHNLLTCLAAPMRARSRPPSTTDSPHGNRQQQVEAVAPTLDQPSTRTEEFRKKCLKRDGYCCVVTKQMDIKHWNESDCPAGVPKGRVEAAQIIPFAYASWDKASTKAPPHGTASAWTVLYRCFPDVLHAEMKPENINNLSNGMTLRNALHDEFGSFSLAFKPTEKENVYQLRVFKKRFSDFELAHIPPSREVVFGKAQDAQDIELPSAAFLDCHWRLSEILNVSGMAEVIEQHFRDWDDINGSTGGCLREDGSTDLGHILHVGLWERVVG